jgi:3',5'-cyclic AMP phosphodiesterase CpdA
VSDLHFGARNAPSDPVSEHALAELVTLLQPTLVIASGDLTHRGTRAQYEEAGRFLRGLGAPVLAVPGNHDLPHTVPARFTHPWREFEREWQTTEPVFASPDLHVVGLNSARPWHHQSGGLSDEQLDEATRRLEAAAPGALRVVALHHQLANAPWRTRKRPLARRSHVLARLADGGADLIVGGHVHQVSVAERHEFAVLPAEARGVVVATAPGFSRPRPGRLGEAQGLLVYTAEAASLAVETYLWRDAGWTATATRTFPRARSAPAAAP